MVKLPTLENTMLLILAGGTGTRLAQVVPHLPKPLAPVADHPFLYWVLRAYRYHGFRDSVIACGYKADLIEAFCAQQPIKDMNLRVVAEPAPLDTGGAIGFAIRHCGRTAAYWLVVNADTITTLNCNKLLESFTPADDGVIAATQQADTSAYGKLWANSQGRIIAFEEKQQGAGWVNMGIYLFTDAMVDNIGPNTRISLERKFLPQAIGAGKHLSLYRCDNPFLDIGTPIGYLSASNFLLCHKKELFGS